MIVKLILEQSQVVVEENLLLHHKLELVDLYLCRLHDELVVPCSLVVSRESPIERLQFFACFIFRSRLLPLLRAAHLYV